jgi:RNA polymerase sigma-70 factor (ECF subfamily)
MNDRDEDRRRVRAMLAGESAAFDAFFNDFFPRLYRFVLPRVEHSHAAAQDICQVALSQAVKRLASYRGEAALFTWLCQIARNTLADYWQRQRKERAHVVYAEDDALARAVLESIEADPRDGPEAKRHNEELARAVQVALDHLPLHYGDALEWKYLDGLSIAEIAERLGSTTVAAQSILQRARTAFREAFDAVAIGAGSRSL